MMHCFQKPKKTPRYSSDQDRRFEYHTLYELLEVGDDFFMDFFIFHFFTNGESHNYLAVNIRCLYQVASIK